MQIPLDIPSLPDHANGPVPPMGPGETAPDHKDLPFEPDSPGGAPSFPPAQSPFPDNNEPLGER